MPWWLWIPIGLLAWLLAGVIVWAVAGRYVAKRMEWREDLPPRKRRKR